MSACDISLLQPHLLKIEKYFPCLLSSYLIWHCVSVKTHQVSATTKNLPLIAMTNKEFFKACLTNELDATANVIAALNSDKLDYRPHPTNRSAYEIAEHIIAHAYDFQVILTQDACDECLVMPFKNSQDGSQLLRQYWEKAIALVDAMDEDAFNTVNVELLVSGKSFVTIPRVSMMWFFFFDIIHHRGQLSTYIRPMGGKNPAVYGYSFDSLQENNS